MLWALVLGLLSHLGNAAPLPQPVESKRKLVLPSLLRDPLESLIGEKCYVSLVENLTFTDLACLKYALSKGLGLGIVIGGSIVKIPQIITIVSKRSVQGLSLASNQLESTAYLIILAYNLRHQNPFSTYGEVVFMSVQNVLVTLLILYYHQQLVTMVLTFIGAVGVLYGCQYLITPWMMAGLYVSTIPLLLASKIPQIHANYVNQSTGQLSVFAVLTYFLGTTARVFTTMTELDDPLMLGSNVLASLLNGILVVQVYLYWGNSSDHERPAKAD
ncbi:uncharacterized protein BYT42DRAFT_509539 [Radiomyces spectabilis]|uniref:uncharacterized protein n=1 Tax=Radiomyces spectabilis TaxID=64574 RepID=UPI0022209785|nr:uncharacterized protein BYT42DRAFT_509539 [Radiomyces spectabilis]KAI8391499.1 hypothetical protein BYT42DRAFT_509539 [Radiomyces spectabilis]